MAIKIVEECADRLIEMKLTLAFAESATAGMLCSEFALTQDAGEFLKGGIVCYDACIKQDLLAVPDELLKKYTPESPEVTEAAARGLKNCIPASICIAVTGLSGPGGSETPEKPVGTMFVCGIISDRKFSRRYLFKGDKSAILRQTVEKVAELLLEEITQIQ